MKTLRFKTNIESTQSVAKISNFIDSTLGIKNWEVDLRSPEKVLTIRGKISRPHTIIKKILKAGYKLTPMN